MTTKIVRIFIGVILNLHINLGGINVEPSNPRTEYVSPFI